MTIKQEVQEESEEIGSVKRDEETQSTELKQDFIIIEGLMSKEL